MCYHNFVNQNIVYFKDRKDWRNWLSSHFESEKEVWFTFPTIASKEVGVSYNDAVEEALCFGWIDGISKTLDKTHQIRRFTPRRKGSDYSQLNIERLIHLNSLNLIHPKVQEQVNKVISVPFVFPIRIINKIQKDPIAWANYQNFSDSYKRIRVAYIEAAKDRPAEYKKRLNNFISKTHDNKIINGYGGTDKYYK